MGGDLFASSNNNTMTEVETFTAIDALKKELEAEATTTRKMLAIVPAEKFDWKPHPKSMSLRTLATHVAELPTWIGMTITADELDFAVDPYKPVEMKSTQELLDYFEQCLADGRKHIVTLQEDHLGQQWTLRQGEMVYVTCSRHEMLRNTFSQIIHHRAQLGVFLRLLDVPIPGSYGPSADEMDM